MNVRTLYVMSFLSVYSCILLYAWKHSTNAAVFSEVHTAYCLHNHTTSTEVWVSYGIKPFIRDVNPLSEVHVI